MIPYLGTKVLTYRDLDKLLIFQLKRAQVVSHVGNIWIGPWANLPPYMDPTLWEYWASPGYQRKNMFHF